MDPKTLIVGGTILLIFLAAIFRTYCIPRLLLDEEDWLGEEAAVNF